MKQIVHKWGASYLMTDEPVTPAPVILTSPEGFTLEPGMQVKQIGKKRRSSFTMLEGHVMTYEGVMCVDGLRYAIFHSAAHDKAPRDLFTQSVQYRYAFSVVLVKGKFECFLLGPGGPKGCWDVRMDYLA